MPDYYVRTYKHWYKWFSRIYDYFTTATCFLFYGFDGERRFRESIVDRLNPRQGEKILDICSGTGTLTIMIARRLAGKGEVTGIEISPDQLRIARRKEKPDGLSFTTEAQRSQRKHGGRIDSILPTIVSRNE